MRDFMAWNEQKKNGLRDTRVIFNFKIRDDAVVGLTQTTALIKKKTSFNRPNVARFIIIIIIFWTSKKT